MFKGKIQAALITLCAFAAMAPAAFASDGTTATVTGGDLTMTNPLADNFAARNVTGADQTTTAALSTFSVSDLTGSGAGWHVTAQATQFAGTNHSLDAGSLSMTAPEVTANGTSSPPPSVNGGIIDDGAVKIASAALDEGMGIYNFSATTLTLVLPADVYADTYASTITLSAITAP